MSSFNIKANRIFSPIRKYGWIFTLIVAFGGLWFEPKLGLLVLPIIASLVVMSFFRGRYWCGNFCTHGSLYDQITLKYSRNVKIPKILRTNTFAVLFFIYFANKIIRKIIKVSALYGTMAFWDKLGFIFVSSYLMVITVGIPLSLIFAPRSWCQICPMGVMQRISYKLGQLLGIAKKSDVKITISSKDMCHSCGKCSRVCPMQLEPYKEFSQTNQFDSDKCIKCKTCVVNCPAHILSIGTEEEAIKLKDTTDNTGFEERQVIKAKVSKKKELKDDVIEFTFTFENPKKVDYKAGQFILVGLPGHDNMNRAYTISSFNENSKSVSVTVKRAGYGTDIMFNDINVGDKIILEGPLGDELVVDKKAEKVLLVGGGIGITPFLPIVRDLMENGSKAKEVKLIYGVNKESELLYDEEFEKLQNKYSQFEYVKLVAFDDNWNGKKGFVTNEMQQMELDGYKVYMCGPKPMVNATVRLLDEVKFDKKNLFVESA